MLSIYYVEGTMRGYDTYDSFVCVAESEEEARRTYPNGNDDYTWSDARERWESTGGWSFHAWDAHISTVSARLIGTAAPGVEVGVICASFNAG